MRNCHFFVVNFFLGKKEKTWVLISPKIFSTSKNIFLFPQTKQNKWQIYVTNHVTYFCDALTELALKIDTYPHELPLVVTANLNEIEHLYHKKTSDCIKACDSSHSSLFWYRPFGPLFGLVCLWTLHLWPCLLPCLLPCLCPCLWPFLWPCL